MSTPAVIFAERVVFQTALGYHYPVMMHRATWHVQLVAVFILLVTLTPYLTAAPGPDPLDAVSRALGLAEQGDLAGARVTLATLPTADTPPLALAARASIELLAGKPTVAEPLFRDVLTQDPQQLSALWGLSLCLLRQGRVYEAAGFTSRALTLAPDNAQVKALHAYVALQLGEVSDAATTGKSALEAGDKSAFLMATLAQIHHRLGYPQKALEFGSFAAKLLNGAEFRTADTGITLPLTLTITDTPTALAPHTPPATGTVTPLDLPATPAATTTEQPRFQIVVPLPDAEVHGTQRVQVVYRGRREISFVSFLVDDVLRGMLTELPYHFTWDADTACPGAHQLTVRAYDRNGLLTDEDALTVKTTSGTALAAAPLSERAAALQQQLLRVTMPTPTALPLFSNLGSWHLEMNETPQAIMALEKAVALDPDNLATLQTLERLYREAGLHAISPNGEVVRGVQTTGQKRVALTFDDGPNPLYTPWIISELARYNGHATFFLVGKMAQKYPDLVLQLLANGEEIANHTYNHPNLTRLEKRDLVREVLQARAVLRDITGRNTYLFRPPGGNIDAEVTQELRALDYNIIYWSINAGEYVKSPPQEQAMQIVSRVQDGSVILLHNGPIDGTINILPTILAELSRRGYTFVTVSEIMKGK